MSYKDLSKAASRYSNMQWMLCNIYENIVKAEKKYLEGLPKGSQDKFTREANEFLKMVGVGRGWGYSWFHSSHVTEIDFEEEGARISFEMADYCRSCYMGQIYDSIFIPANLIDIFDDSNDETSWNDEEAAVMAFVEDRARQVREHFAAKEAEAKIAAEERRIAREARREAKDRVDWERLKAKFGDQ